MAALGSQGGGSSVSDNGFGIALEDAVLTLTRYSDADISDHLAGEDEETARRFGWWPNSSTPETVKRALEEWAEHWRTNGPTRTFATREKESGRLVGGCRLRLRSDGVALVSYWTSASERGKGYATRSLQLVCEYARSIGVTELEAEIADDNLGSRSVAERVGFANVEVFTEAGPSMCRYRKTFRLDRG